MDWIALREKATDCFKKYRYVLLVLAAGMILLLLPEKKTQESVTPQTIVEEKQGSENLRTITIVSNPGTENEKTESIQVPCGLQVSISSYWEIEETFAVYADAACTRTFEEEWDVNTDLTLYVKWGE